MGGRLALRPRYSECVKLRQEVANGLPRAARPACAGSGTACVVQTRDGSLQREEPV